MGQFLPELFGQRIEMADGSHADCLHPDIVAKMKMAEQLKAALGGDPPDDDDEEGDEEDPSDDMDDDADDDDADR